MFFVYKRVRQGLNRAAAQSAATKAPVGLLLARGSESVGMSAKNVAENRPLSRITATAPPKWEPRMWRNSSCLSLRERWQRRKALTERARPLAGMASWPSQSASLGRSPSGTGVPPPPRPGESFPKGEPRTLRRSPCLPLRGRWHPEGMTERASPLTEKQALSVCFADSSPKGRAKNAAEQPLPPTLGEVARRKP